MVKIYGGIVLFTYVLVSLMVWFIKPQPTLDQTTIEAGQIWLSETDNPFREDIYWYIIETKEEYVRFASTKYNKDEDLWVIPTQKQYGISNKISTFKNIYVRVK